MGIHVNVINGRRCARGVARGTGEVFAAAFVLSIALQAALFVALVALAVVLVMLAVAVVRRRRAMRRPVAPAVPVRLNDAAARAHRARMAAILANTRH